MSALARYFKQNGYQVAGYDRTPSSLTQRMQEEEGISVDYRDEVDAIPEEYRNPVSTLLIYTPAIPADNRQLAFFQENGFLPL